MNFFDQRFTGNKQKKQQISRPSSIRSLLPKPRDIYSEKIVDLCVNQTNKPKQVFLSSIRAAKIVYQQQDEQVDIQDAQQSAYEEPSAAFVDKDQHHQRCQEQIRSQAAQNNQSIRQTIVKRFYFQNFIQQILNDKITRLSILNDMIYQPFNYIFVLQGYLQSLSENKLNESDRDKMAIIGMINDAQNHQLTKCCLKDNLDKQNVIKNIFKTKYSKYVCENIVSRCIKSSQSIHDSSKLLYKNWILQQTKSQTFQGNQDISYLVKYIKQKEDVYSEVYK